MRGASRWAAWDRTAWLRAASAVLMAGMVWCTGPTPVEAQESLRDRLGSLRLPPVTFDAPEPQRREVRGVPVLFLPDPAVPLVTVLARFQGGYAHLARDRYGAGVALPSLLRYGGTTRLPPDSVDERLEFYAIQTSFGGGGESIFATLNTLSEHLEPALEIWTSMLRDPGFDSTEVEVWRGREMENIRRREDDPGRLAFAEFNRLLYGDHPIGWEMTPEDLNLERVTPAILQEIHRDLICPGHLTLGVTGDVRWEELEPMLDGALAAWPPCPVELPEPRIPEVARLPGVYVIAKELEQSVIVMAHPTDVRLSEDQDYFSAQIGNSILGAGGFSSRLMARLRTEEGFAYSASSLWTTPRRFEGIVGAITRTRPENTVPAVRLILDILDEAGDRPPTGEEVGTAVDQIVNGFVFNFDSPAQIVSRQMFYLAQDLPLDWLERYLRGIQRVTPASVQTVFRRHLRPEAMTILVVGDPDRIGLEALESLGPVHYIELVSVR